LEYEQTESIVLDVYGILSGAAILSIGYDMVDRRKDLAINKAILCEMGSYKTAEDFVEKMLMKHLDKKILCSSTVVGGQLLEQLEVVAPFSSAMDKGLKKDPDYESITINLKTYLESTGAGGNSIVRIYRNIPYNNSLNTLYNMYYVPYGILHLNFDILLSYSLSNEPKCFLHNRKLLVQTEQE
jgi:hypothetical protein